MEDKTEAEQWFDYWSDAAQWLIDLANGDGLPSIVIMTMESE